MSTAAVYFGYAAPPPRQGDTRQRAKGVRLKAPDVVEHFSCSVKTALRDLSLEK